MRSSSSRSVAGLAVLCCALSACGSGTSASTPSVAVSSVAAPSPVASAPASPASRTPTASPSGSYDPALVAEAEKVFREYQATFTKWQQKGGSSQLPGEFADLTAMPLKTEVATLLRDQKTAGWRLESTSNPVIVIHGPISSVRRPGQAIALAACVSYHDMAVINRDGTRKAGVAYEYHAFFSGTVNHLRYFDVESAQVQKC